MTRTLLVLLLAASVGCAGPIINTPVPQALPGALVPADTVLISTPVRIPRDVVVAGTPSSLRSRYQAGSLRFRAFERELNQQLVSLGGQVVQQRDLAGQLPESGFVVRTEVTGYRELVEKATLDVVLCGVLAGITIGLGALACANTRNTTTHVLEVELRVFPVLGARMQRVEARDEVRQVIDTSELRPVFSQTYRVEVRSGLSAMGSGRVPPGPAGEQFIREQGERLAQMLFLEVKQPLARRLVAETARPRAIAPQPPERSASDAPGQAPDRVDDGEAVLDEGGP